MESSKGKKIRVEIMEESLLNSSVKTDINLDTVLLHHRFMLLLFKLKF